MENLYAFCNKNIAVKPQKLTSDYKDKKMWDFFIGHPADDVTHTRFSPPAHHLKIILNEKHAKANNALSSIFAIQIPIKAPPNAPPIHKSVFFIRYGTFPYLR